MTHQSYVLTGEINLGQCNIVDRWNGNFLFTRKQIFPCGHQMYLGDVAIQQANCWNFNITRDNDFSFDLMCQCGCPIGKFDSAYAIYDRSGWPYLF